MNPGERIKSLRIQKGFSQEELGERIGVKKAAINKYENGTVVNLKRSTIVKLAEVLDVSPLYILGMEEDGKDSTTQKISPDELQLTEGETALIQLFRKIPQDKQRIVIEMIRAALSAEG